MIPPLFLSDPKVRKRRKFRKRAAAGAFEAAFRAGQVCDTTSGVAELPGKKQKGQPITTAKRPAEHVYKNATHQHKRVARTASGRDAARPDP